MYGEETAGRQYVKKKITQREPEYDKNTDRHRRKSTQVKWTGWKTGAGLGFGIYPGLESAAVDG